MIKKILNKQIVNKLYSIYPKLLKLFLTKNIKT